MQASAARHVKKHLWPFIELSLHVLSNQEYSILTQAFAGGRRAAPFCHRVFESVLLVERRHDGTVLNAAFFQARCAPVLRGQMGLSFQREPLLADPCRASRTPCSVSQSLAAKRLAEPP